MTEFHYHQATQYSLWTHGMDEPDSTEQRRENVKQLRERIQLSGAYVVSNGSRISSTSHFVQIVNDRQLALVRRRNHAPTVHDTICVFLLAC
jgi:hypothetical protein